MIIPHKVQDAMGHEVLQVVGQGFALGVGFPRTDPEGQGHIAKVGFRVQRGRKGQDIGRLGLLTEISD